MSIRPILEKKKSNQVIEGAGVRLDRAFGFGKTAAPEPLIGRKAVARSPQSSCSSQEPRPPRARPMAARVSSRSCSCSAGYGFVTASAHEDRSLASRLVLCWHCGSALCCAVFCAFSCFVACTEREETKAARVRHTERAAGRTKQPRRESAHTK